VSLAYQVFISWGCALGQPVRQASALACEGACDTPNKKERKKEKKRKKERIIDIFVPTLRSGGNT